MITLLLYIGSLPNLAIPCGRGRTLFILGSLGQGHRYYKYKFWQQDRFRTTTLVLYIKYLPNLATWFPCGRGRTLFILGSLGQGHSYYKYNFWQQGRFHMITLVLYIGSWPNLATWFPCGMNRVLSFPQGNHVAKFGKDPKYRTKVIVRKRLCCQKIYL
jgi:hypothetical protein